MKRRSHYIRNAFTLFAALAALAGLLTTATSAFALPPPHIELDPSFGTLSETFTLRITVEGQPIASLTNPTFPSNDSFAFRRGPTSTRQQWTNGVQRYEVHFLLGIAPSRDLKPGKYRIPDGRMNIAGEEVILPGPEITILTDESGSRAEADQKVEGISFTHLVSNLAPYIGQQILYRAEMASTRPIQLASLNDIEPPGFLRESLGDERQREQQIGGTSRTSLIEALFPAKPGELVIPQRELNLQVAIPRRHHTRPSLPRRRFGTLPYGNPLDSPLEAFENSLLDGFRVEIEERKLVAKPFTVNVRPLPDPKAAGLSEPLSGYVPVGHLDTNFRLNADAIHLGESVTLSVTLAGDANLRPYELPQPKGNFSRDFKLYSEKPELEVIPSRDGVKFSKTFKLSFVPQRTGNLKLPVIDVIWFDPKEERYVAFRIENQAITVLPDPNSQQPEPAVLPVPGAEQSGQQKPDAAPTPRDLAPPHEIALASPLSRELPWRIVFAVAAAVALCSAFALLRRKRKTQDPVRDQLTAAKARIAAADSLDTMASELPRLVGAILGDGRRTLTLHESAEVAKAKVTNEALGTELAEYLLLLEKTMYGGGAKTPEQSAKLLADGRALAARFAASARKPAKLRNLQRAAMFLVPIFFSMPDAGYAEPSSKPDEAFLAGRFDEAREGYETLLQAGHASASLYYNLGNVYYRLHHFGRALVSYEKALLLDPANADASENLGRTLNALSPALRDAARETLTALRFPPPFTAAELQVLFLFSWCLGWFFVLRVSRGRRLTSLFSASLCCLLAVCSSLGFIQHRTLVSKLPAVIVEEGTRVFAAADSGAQVISVLPDAKMVRYFQEKNGWRRIAVEGGRSGWVESGNVELPSKL